MWIADNWKDYEVIDTSNGEKLERWGDFLLIRPDPQVIWDTPKSHRGWRNMNGHYHRSGIDVIEGVPRLDVNSATFNWIPKPHDLFPEKEWYKEYECIGNMVIYEKPVSAEVIIDTDEQTVEVIGCEGNFLHDVSTEASGNVSGSRLSTADMVSAKVKYGIENN